ncbi:hypothetical protein [Streptomyces violens]|uniref:hypothetical protein n=1 Tax=Streptomyces violens TaxID=66377 RepID=UPI0012FEC422|nr:hypothetical protein [Streptomyces violens]
MPASEETVKPSVAFGVIPDLGVAAAAAENNALVDEVLRQHGFAHDLRRDIYLLPPGTEHHVAVQAVAASNRKLQAAGLSVAADPRVVTTGPQRKPPPGPSPHTSLAGLSAALPTLEEPTDVADWLRRPVEGPAGAIPELQQFIGAAATWCDRLDQPDGPALAHHLRNIAEHIEVLGDRLTHVSQYLDALPPVTQDAGRARARSNAATASSPHRPAAAAKAPPPEATQHLSPAASAARRAH